MILREQHQHVTVVAGACDTRRGHVPRHDNNDDASYLQVDNKQKEVVEYYEVLDVSKHAISATQQELSGTLERGSVITQSRVSLAITKANAYAS